MDQEQTQHWRFGSSRQRGDVVGHGVPDCAADARVTQVLEGKVPLARISQIFGPSPILKIRV
jgi:hypothetical protein